MRTAVVGTHDDEKQQRKDDSDDSDDDDNEEEEFALVAFVLRDDEYQRGEPRREQRDEL